MPNSRESSGQGPGRMALVSGSAVRVAEVADGLEAMGYSVSRSSDEEELRAACAVAGQGSIDCYVQLPVEIEPHGTTVVDRFHDLLAQGLLCRFRDAAQVLPKLAEGAAVVLVSGNLLTEEALPDDQQARAALLRVLSHAILADRGDPSLSVRVLDSRRSVADVLAAVRDRGGDRMQMVAEFAHDSPDMSYDDWRLALLSMAATES